MAKAGDKVKIKTNTDEVEGILMPSSDEEVLIIKLDNGYNLGFERKSVLAIKLLEEKKQKKDFDKEKGEDTSKTKSATAQKKGLPVISILHCGGTIASKVDYETGAVTSRTSPAELLEMFPELGELAEIRSILVANMFSENMRFAHYNLIAKEIEKEIKEGTTGIIVTHGTDTLHYTAAALAFVLENLSVPVLLVGSQRSSDRGSSDAFLNLKCAVQFITKTDFSEVGVCMHSSENDDQCAIIPASKSRKMHSSRRDAFKVINDSNFALVDGFGKIKWLNRNYTKKDANRNLSLKLFNEQLKIGLIKSHPQFFSEELRIYEKFEGLVLEGTGLGHFPVEKSDDYTDENESIFREIKKLAETIPVVMTTQTIFGAVNMNVYSPGRRLAGVGVLGNGLDLTAETALIKLAWLLSNYDKNKIRELWATNFRGELSSARTYRPDYLK